MSVVEMTPDQVGQLLETLKMQNAEIVSVAKSDDVVELYIYIDTEDTYFRRSDKQRLKPAAVNRLHKAEYPGKGESATNAIDMSPDKRVVSGVGWYPSDNEIINLNGVRHVNTYQPPLILPVQGDVTEWTDLCQYIYGEHTELVLDHHAFSLQNPATKIRWQNLICGAPRTGKSMTVRPLLKIWGASGVSMSPEEIQSGWGDGLVGKKFVVMEEVFMPDNRQFFNNLKTKLANDDIERINPKGKGLIVQPNLYSMSLFTNHMDSLKFNEDEDKLLVIEAPSEKLSKETYKSLANNIDSPDGKLNSNIYEHLMSRDVTEFEYGTLPVRTDAAKKMSRESMADYQKAIGRMIDGKEYPFNQACFQLEDLRKELFNRHYTKFGDDGISEVLNQHGIHKYRGKKKVGGQTHNTPVFWAVSPPPSEKPADIYEWYQCQGVRSW